MKAYMKPDVFVTEFQVNAAVASCNRDYIGSVTTYPAQTVTCINGTQDVIFNDAAAGCQMFFKGLVYMEEGTYSSRDAAIVAIGQAAANISTFARPDQGGSYTLAAGYYAYWVDSTGNDHAGTGSSLDVDQYTNSY